MRVLTSGAGDAVEVRPVRASEYAAAGEATALAYREFVPADSPIWDAYLARIRDVASRAARSTVLVAVDDGVIAGSVSLELTTRIEPDSGSLAPDEAHMRMLGVRPDRRGRGIGRRLVIACIDLAAHQGRRRMTLDTTARMTSAQALYSSLGFVRVGTRHTSGLELLSYALEGGQ